MCTSTIKNLTRDGLGLTSDRVTRRRILLEEYAPEIIYVKEGIHNTVAYAISWLDYDPKLNLTNEDNHATHVMSTKEEGCQKGLMFSKFCPAITKHRIQSKHIWFKWIMYSQTAVRRMKYTPWQWKRLWKPKKQTLHSNTSLTALPLVAHICASL